MKRFAIGAIILTYPYARKQLAAVLASLDRLSGQGDGTRLHCSKSSVILRGFTIVFAPPLLT